MQDTETPTEEPSALPGCGLASYALLLVVLGAVGVVGMVGASYALIQAGKGQDGLMSGMDVQPFRLEPMWRSGLLPHGEAPLAWHDESPGLDGTVACALLTDGVGRVEGGVASRLGYAEVQDVRADGDPDGDLRVTVTGGAAPILCSFGEEQGGPRFLRQLESEVARARAAQGAAGAGGGSSGAASSEAASPPSDATGAGGGGP